MAAHNNSLLNLKVHDGPVWVRGQDNRESQPVIRLWTQEHEVIVPANYLLASSVMLRQILCCGDFLPVPYHAPVVILPSVTVDVANHVMDLVTTGKTDANDPAAINKIKEALEVLQIPGTFDWGGNGGNSDDVVENSDGADAGEIYNANRVKTEEEAEYIIKIEFDDDSIQDPNENLTISSETNDLPEKKSYRKQNINQDRNTVRHDCNGQVYYDANETSKLSKNQVNKRRGSRRLSAKNAKSDQIDGVQTPAKTTVSNKIRKQFKNATNKVAKPFKCNLCDVGFNCKSELQRHMNVHNAVYSCDQCDHKAQTRSKLMKHKIGKHTTDKPYNCDKCDYRSGWPSKLWRHKRVVHEGRTYNCKQCNFKGKYKRSLVVHRQLIHEDTVYHCNECSYKTKVEYYLKSHKLHCHERNE